MCALFLRWIAASPGRIKRRTSDVFQFLLSILRAVTVPACLACALLLSAPCGPPARLAGQATQSDGMPPSTMRVERRDFRRTIRLHGTIEAVRSFTVIAPRLSGQTLPTMVITKLAENGSRIRRGDILVEFDRQNQMKTVLDREAEYQDLVEQIKRKQADQLAASARDETELKGAEVDLQAAQVDMRKNEVVSKIEAEINTQNLAEAEARLKSLHETLGLRRTAAEAELRILEIQRDRALNAMVYAQDNIERMTIRSPLDGLAVLTPVYRSSRYVDPQEGDEVRAGYAIMLVVDPDAMQARVRVNQVDMSWLRPGQTAEVRLEAYPDLVLPAVFEGLGATGTSSYYSKQIRLFPAIVTIHGSNPILVPDLTAAVDVLVERLDQVFLVPREAIVVENGRTMVEVVRDGRSELLAVTVGPMNDFEAVIASGIEEGATISLHPRPRHSVASPLPE